MVNYSIKVPYHQQTVNGLEEQLNGVDCIGAFLSPTPISLLSLCLYTCLQLKLYRHGLS
jgi:hypothetical protein